MTSIEELESRIDKLIEENLQLREWQGSVSHLLNQMIDMISAHDAEGVTKDELNKLWQFAMINRYRIDSLPYEMMDPDYQSFFYKPRILSAEDTICQLTEKHKSFARFGDGEFAAIVGQKRWNFQQESEVLSRKLSEVLASDDDNLLIGLNPNFYQNLLDHEESDADGVRAYMRPMVRRLHAEHLSPDRIYGDALFHNIDSVDRLNKLKAIWNNRHCVFIEGVHTGMGVGNDLFDNCASIERILGPAENAINVYEKILEEAQKQPKDKLILIAMGPTATVLAYELNKNGYQAIDVGHMDLIYESFIRRLPNLYSVDIPYKYCTVDERISGRDIPNIDEPIYKSQVIATITVNPSEMAKPVSIQEK